MTKKCYYSKISKITLFKFYSRTLITFCVESDEIGKIYATVGIWAAVMPLISNPAYKQLYNAVSDFFQSRHSQALKSTYQENYRSKMRTNISLERQLGDDGTI